MRPGVVPPQCAGSQYAPYIIIYGSWSACSPLAAQLSGIVVPFPGLVAGCASNPLLQQLVTSRLPYPRRPTAVLPPTSPVIGLTPHVYRSLLAGPLQPPAACVDAASLTPYAHTPVAARTPVQPSAKGTEVLDLSAKRRATSKRAKLCAAESLAKRVRREVALSRELLHGQTTLAAAEVVTVAHARCDAAPSGGGGGGGGVVGEVESSTDSDIRTWDVNHVVRFVASVPGCQDYAEVRWPLSPPACALRRRLRRIYTLTSQG